MIQITVTGLEQIETLSTMLEPTIMETIAKDVLRDILETFIKIEIIGDPEIPEEYKAGVRLVETPTQFIILYYVPEYWEEKRRKKELVTRLEWIIYRCVKRGYYAGKLTPSVEYLRERYIERKWQATGQFYLNMFRDIFRSKLEDMLRGRM